MHNYWLNQLSNRESVLTINKCFSEVMIYDGEFKVYMYDIKDNHQLQPVDLVFSVYMLLALFHHHPEVISFC